MRVRPAWRRAAPRILFTDIAMARENIHEQPTPPETDERADALAAFIYATEKLTPDDMDRINADWGLAPGQPPVDMGLDAARVASALRSARSPEVPKSIQGPPHAVLVEWSAAPRPVSSCPGLGGEGEFRAQVQAASMIEAGLAPGDSLLACARPAVDGDIVLAEVAGVGFLLRRLATFGGVAVLCADNRTVKGVALDADVAVRVHGVVRRPASNAGD